MTGSTKPSAEHVRRMALTGGIATGKSYVLDRFAAFGVPTIDADQLAHASITPNGPAWPALRDRFGTEMFDDQGRVDRSKLGALVFADDAARAELNAIVHPHVRVAIDRWFADLETSGVPQLGIVAIPLLYESRRAESFDRVIVTACHDDTQLARVMARGFTTDEARRRIGAQLPTREKVRRGDHVVWTDGTYTETDQQVDTIYERLSADTPTDRDQEAGD